MRESTLKHINAAKSNCRLSGMHVDDEVVNMLVQVLENNPEITLRELINLFNINRNIRYLNIKKDT